MKMESGIKLSHLGCEHLVRYTFKIQSASLRHEEHVFFFGLTDYKMDGIGLGQQCLD
jgi:hypothetical protein